MLPILRSEEIRPPVVGWEELQVESGVETTILQSEGMGLKV